MPTDWQEFRKQVFAESMERRERAASQPEPQPEPEIIGYVKIDPPSIVYNVKPGWAKDDYREACEAARAEGIRSIIAVVDGGEEHELYVPHSSDRCYEIMRKLEGVCPECGFLKLRIVRIGGCPSFHAEHQWDGEGIEIDVWREGNPNDLGYEWGGLFYQCMMCGARPETWASPYGDWT